MSVGILPNVNSLKLNRDAKQETSVCSRTTRLKNNQVKSRQRAFKKGKSGDKSAVAVVKTVPQGGNPRRKVLGSIRRVRFTQSTLRQASI